MARLNITRHTSYSGFAYYTTAKGHHRIPEKLTNFLNDYKVIGKLVYVPSPTAGKNPTPDWSLEKIKELMQKHGKSATLKSVMQRNPTEKTWVAADAKQTFDYFKRHRTLELYVEAFLVKREKEQRKYRATVAVKTLKQLETLKVVSADTVNAVYADVHKYLNSPLATVVTEVPKATAKPTKQVEVCPECGEEHCECDGDMTLDVG